MDRTLKERLIGAAVLVIAAVWIVPAILDGPTQPAETEAPGNAGLQLPVPDAGGGGSVEPIRRRTIELDPDRGIPQSASASESAPGVPVEDPLAADEPNGAEPRSEAPVTAGGAEAVSAAEPPPEPAVVRASGVPILQSPGDEGWMVQLGSFSDAGNAQRQAERVAALGYTPRIFEFSAAGRLMYRVRVGPEPGREEAEAAARALSANGFVAQVVRPE